MLWLLRTLMLRLVLRRTEDAPTRYHWRKGTNYVAFLVGLLVVGRIWFPAIQSLATFLGLVTAGLAIALQDLVRSIAGWAFILWRRPCSVGDQIEIGSHRVRYLIEPRKRRGSEQAVWGQVLREFAAREDIDFAYPTQRFYDNVAEGKPQARARPAFRP